MPIPSLPLSPSLYFNTFVPGYTQPNMPNTCQSMVSCWHNSTAHPINLIQSAPFLLDNLYWQTWWSSNATSNILDTPYTTTGYFLFTTLPMSLLPQMPALLAPMTWNHPNTCHTAQSPPLSLQPNHTHSAHLCFLCPKCESLPAHSMGVFLPFSCRVR